MAMGNNISARCVLNQAGDFLKSATVDDVVVIFFAGHGTLDGAKNYYFATADHDFANPAKFGLSYDDIEGLLDNTRARRKLLLMDTCYSGEADRPDSDIERLAGETRRDNVSSTSRGVDRDDASYAKINDPFRMLRELFADLRHSTGAIVIASTGGDDVAWESAPLKNGIFTHALLRGLAGEADQDKNGRVFVSELQDFIESEVRRWTRNQQIPAARHENLAIDFSL